MSDPRRNKHTRLAALAWALNGVGVVAILVILGIYFTRQPAQAAPGLPLLSKFGPRPTLTPAPTSYYLPTVTPNPLATEVEDYSTPTPFVFAGGPAPGIIGYSVEGRPIEAYSFGQGELHYLIVAGIHGGYEGNTIDLANQLLVYLSEHPNAVPSGDTLYLIPDMNPDGAARGRNPDGRVNANGVDLNRNFPARNWQPDWDHGNCWNERPTTGGVARGSEPETRAIASFILSHRIQAMISYHSAALGVFPGGDPWQPESERLAKALSEATGYPYPPIDIGCVYTGTLADWAVETGVGAAVDMELSTHRDPDFSRNLRALQALLTFNAD
jgi:murein peptide amidase A